MLSFKKLDKSKLFAQIVDKKKSVVIDTLYINEKYENVVVQDSDFAKRIHNYADKVEEKDGIVHSFELKDGYIIENCPPEFNDVDEREVSYIVAKSGSGKSYFTAAYVDKYHTKNPHNRIYYVSVNKITNDKSFDELLKKKSFNKIFSQINLMTCNTTIEFANYRNCLWIFDDIIDVDIPVNVNDVLDAAIVEIMNKEVKKKDDAVARKAKYIPTPREKQAIQEQLTMIDQIKLSNVAKRRSDVLKKNIKDSILMLLKAGRKNKISVICTNHEMFSSETPAPLITEAQKIIIFPYGNVSPFKLKEFLTKKTPIDSFQANNITANSFMKYEPLVINVNGINFYFTLTKFQFL